MIFADYIDQMGIIVILLSVLAFLISFIFQKHRIKVKTICISTFLVTTFFTGFLSYGLYLEQSIVSEKDISEVRGVIAKFEENKHFLIENTSQEIGYLHVIEKLNQVLLKENFTYKDLSATGYKGLRDDLHLELYNLYKNSYSD